MPKKRPIESNTDEDFIHESDDDPNKLVIEGPRKKRLHTEESSKIVTSTGEKLDLKKSKQIRDAKRKKEEKLTKNRKRELKQIEERKVKKQTVSKFKNLILLFRELN